MQDAAGRFGLSNWQLALTALEAAFDTIAADRLPHFAKALAGIMCAKLSNC